MSFADSYDFDYLSEKESKKRQNLYPTSMIGVFDADRTVDLPKFFCTNLITGIQTFIPLVANQLRTALIQAARVVVGAVQKYNFPGDFSGVCLLHRAKNIYMFERSGVYSCIYYPDQKNHWITVEQCSWWEKIPLGTCGTNELPSDAEFIIVGTKSFWESFQAFDDEKRAEFLMGVSNLVATNRNLDVTCHGLCNLARANGMQKNIQSARNDISCAIMAFDNADYDPLLAGRENTNKEEAIVEKASANQPANQPADKPGDKVKKDLNKDNSSHEVLLPE